MDSFISALNMYSVFKMRSSLTPPPFPLPQEDVPVNLRAVKAASEFSQRISPPAPRPTQRPQGLLGQQLYTKLSEDYQARVQVTQVTQVTRVSRSSPQVFAAGGGGPGGSTDWESGETLGEYIRESGP